MDELEKGLEISVDGTLKRDALQRFREQIDRWDIPMPPVEPLVLDFGLGKFRETGLIEYWIANETEAGYCGKYLFVFDGQTCPMHRHKHKRETFFVVKGRLHVELDGNEHDLAAGEVLTVREEQKHTFTGIGPCLLLELSEPCVIDDNYFEDQRIPIGGDWNA